VAKFIPWCSPSSTDTGNEPLALDKEEVLLVMLAVAQGKELTPVQIQKSLFLADEEVRPAFRASSRYKFEPYDYGPFDKQVYADAQALAAKGLVKIGTDPRGWSTYAATPEGLQRGAVLRGDLNDGQREMLDRIVGLVRRLSFTALVSAIYKKYPRMRERSVFRD
jgi:hypothetical protein